MSQRVDLKQSFHKINTKYMNMMGKSTINPKMADTDTYFQGQEMSHEIYYRDYNTPELQEKIQEKQKIHSQTSLNFNNHNNSSNQNAKSKLLK